MPDRGPATQLSSFRVPKTSCWRVCYAQVQLCCVCTIKCTADQETSLKAIDSSMATGKAFLPFEVGAEAQEADKAHPGRSTTVSPSRRSFGSGGAVGAHKACPSRCVRAVERHCWACHRSEADNAVCIVCLTLMETLLFAVGAVMICCCCGPICEGPASDGCDAVVDCGNDFLSDGPARSFPCNVTSAPDSTCIVLMRPTNETGMCTCADACTTAPFAQYTPIEFSATVQGTQQSIYCQSQSGAYGFHLFLFLLAAVFSLVSTPFMAWGRPQALRVLSIVACCFTICFVVLLGMSLDSTLRAQHECQDGYHNIAVPGSIPPDLHCEYSSSFGIVGVEAGGILVAGYLAALLHLRGLARSGKGLLLDVQQEGGGRLLEPLAQQPGAEHQQAGGAVM